MAVGQRFHQGPGRARSRNRGASDRRRQGQKESRADARQDARCRRRSLPPGPHRARARHGSRGSRAQARQRPYDGLQPARRGRARAVALFAGPALPRKRPGLHHAHALAVLVQLRRRRLRGLPRFRPRDRCRLGPGDPEREAHAAHRRGEGHPDAGLEGNPGRPAAPRRSRRHSARHGLGQDDGRAESLGAGRLDPMERQVEPDLVWHQALLRIPGKQGLQDAHPRALVEVPQLHRVPHLPGRAPQDRKPAVAPGQQGRRRRRAATGPAFHARGRVLEPGAARSPAWPVPA